MAKKAAKPKAKAKRAYGTGSVVVHAGRAKPYEARPAIKDALKRRLPSRYFAGEAEAHRYLDDLHAAARIGQLEVKRRIPFGRLVDEWLAEIDRSSLKPYTKDDYHQNVAKNVLPEIGASTWIDEITVDTVRALEARLSKRLARRSVDLALSVLSNILQMACADGLLERSPVAQMRLSRRKREQKPKTPRKRLLWTPAHEAAFVAAAQSAPYGELWLLLALRGLRIGEGRALLWRNVDLEGGLLTVEATLYYKSQTHWARVSTKNEAGLRVLPLNDVLRDVLAARKRAAYRVFGDDFVFTWPDGRLPAYETWRNWLIKLCAQAKVPTVTAHQLRHLAVTRMAEAGIGVDVRQVAFGHASAAMNEHYTHVLDERVVSAFARMDAAAAIEDHYRA